MTHLVLHPVEAPAFELDMVLYVKTPPTQWQAMVEKIPLEMVRCCKPSSIRIMAVTPDDVPVRVTAKVSGHSVVVKFHDDWERPSGVWVHLVGTARTSPPAWERHSRQQFTRNRKTFGKALP